MMAHTNSRRAVYSDSKEKERDGSRKSVSSDDVYLARLGKKPVLRRNFGMLSVLGFSCTILVTWEGIACLFIQPLFNGGPAGAIYGFIFVWIGTACVFAVLSELASMAPTSGGQYHWVAMLAPPSSTKFLSYLCGWLTLIGWQATFATACYLDGTMIQGLAVLTNPAYVPAYWHATMYYWAVVAFGVGINVVGRNVLPRFEGLILVVHILGFFAVLIPLLSLAEFGDAKTVFTEFNNEGGWPTQGLSVMVGLTGSIFAFAGGDAAVHMSEEITHATTAVPRSILLSVLINGSLGFAMLLAFLFCLGDLDRALASPTGYPFMEVFLSGTGSRGGAAAMAAIVVTVCICSATGMLAAASRQFWAFSRDRGVPGWRVWSQVNPQTAIPTYAVAVTTTIASLLALIPLGSSIAFNQLCAMSISGLNLSYILVASLLLWRRTTGAISHSNPSSRPSSLVTAVSPTSPTVTTAAGPVPGATYAFPDPTKPQLHAQSKPQPEKNLVWGPFHIPGLWGVTINILAILYALIAVFFSFWPMVTPVTVQTMNFSVVGTVGVLVLSVVYYFLVARGVYGGPVVEVDSSSLGGLVGGGRGR